MTQENLFDCPPSDPPRLTMLREQLMEAEKELERAEQWTDETGEPTPDRLRRRVDSLQRAVWREEHRIVHGPKTDG